MIATDVRSSAFAPPIARPYRHRASGELARPCRLAPLLRVLCSSCGDVELPVRAGTHKAELPDGWTMRSYWRIDHLGIPRYRQSFDCSACNVTASVRRAKTVLRP